MSAFDELAFWRDVGTNLLTDSQLSTRMPNTGCRPRDVLALLDAKQAAEQEAGALAIRLGDGWTGDVWENLGWHYRAVSACGRIKVHPTMGGDFTAFLGEAGSAGGYWTGEGPTPQVAVANAIAKGRRELEGHMRLLDGL